AEVIYKAATDGTNQLRYIIGADADLYVNGRINNSDQEYFNLMNSYFLKDTDRAYEVGIDLG
ncbi:MAG TPA: hypothetical protein VGC08_03790, partial [Pedobacter sp.]